MKNGKSFSVFELKNWKFELEIRKNPFGFSRKIVKFFRFRKKYRKKEKQLLYIPFSVFHGKNLKFFRSCERKNIVDFIFSPHFVLRKNKIKGEIFLLKMGGGF